jgi:preprotein translocase subunit YajC
MTLIVLLAETTQQAATTTGGASGSGGSAPPPWFDLMQKGPLFFFVAIIGLMFYLQFRAKKKQDHQRKDMLGGMKRGDRVQTIGGILGTVVEAREDEIIVKVDESSNTKIHFTRSAIHRVLGGEKTDSK